MKQLLAILLAALTLMSSAFAGTVTVTTAGFANLPATPPANWPSYVTYPGAVTTNGTHTYTVNDADWVRLMTWTAAGQFKANTDGSPATPSALQILLSWVQIWWSGTQAAEQNFGTPAPVKPPPINVQ